MSSASADRATSAGPPAHNSLASQIKKLEEYLEELLSETNGLVEQVNNGKMELSRLARTRAQDPERERIAKEIEDLQEQITTLDQHTAEFQTLIEECRAREQRQATVMRSSVVTVSSAAPLPPGASALPAAAASTVSSAPSVVVSSVPSTTTQSDVSNRTHQSRTSVEATVAVPSEPHSGLGAREPKNLPSFRIAEKDIQLCSRYRSLVAKAGVPETEVFVAHVLMAELPEYVRMQVTMAHKLGVVPRLTINDITQFVGTLPVALDDGASSSSAGTATARQSPRDRGHDQGGHKSGNAPASQPVATSGGDNAARAGPGYYGKGQSRWQGSYKKKKAAHGYSGAASGGADDLARGAVNLIGAVDPSESISPEFTRPVTINGVKTLALVDTGATHSCLLKWFAEQLQLPITPAKGLFHTASGDGALIRIGATAPIHIVSDSIDAMWSFEVIPLSKGLPVLIGRDLLMRYGDRRFGLPFERVAEGDTLEPEPERRPPLVDADFAKVELEPDFVEFRESVLAAAGDVLDANAAIPANAYCPLQESVVHLETPDGKVVFRRQYPIAHRMMEPIDAVIREWENDGVITRAPVGTAFNTPIFAVPKKDLNGVKRCRVCADFRPLNALLADDSFPLPLMSDIFTALAGAAVFSTLDLKAAYHRFTIAPEDRHKTCFTWQDKQYVFARAPFGLKTLPSIFQRVMQIILADMPFARAYVDDVIVFSKERDEHADHVRQVVQRLTANNLVLNRDKCHFVRLRISLLGFLVTPDGREVDPERVANVSEWPTPTTGKQLQHYLGFANFFREHIPLMARATSALNGLRSTQDLRPCWTDEHETSFPRLKELMHTPLQLAFPDFSAPFCIATDASNVGIGAVLYQMQRGSEKPCWISFQARAMSKSERNYSATKRELLAVIFALRKFHYFIWGARFTLFTDHAALTYLHTQTRLNPMLAGWYEIIFDYDFNIVHRPGILNILPDHLSRLFASSTLEGEETQPSRAILVMHTSEHAESVRPKPYTVSSSKEHEQTIAQVRECVEVMQQQLFPEVASRSRATADKTAQAFNKKHRTMKIPSGTFVMVRDKLRKSKLEPANKGPFKVVSMTRGGSYVLEDNEGQSLPHNFPPSALISLSTNPNFAQASFEVESILDHEESDAGMRYLVRWKQYSPEHDSWEPEENFDDQGVIHDYWSRRGQAGVKG